MGENESVSSAAGEETTNLIENEVKQFRVIVIGVCLMLCRVFVQREERRAERLSFRDYPVGKRRRSLLINCMVAVFLVGLAVAIILTILLTRKGKDCRSLFVIGVWVVACGWLWVEVDGMCAGRIID